jgi:hypothetical protein
MSHIISKVQSLVRAGLMPYWDVDPEEIDSDGKPGINAIKRFYGFLWFYAFTLLQDCLTINQTIELFTRLVTYLPDYLTIYQTIELFTRLFNYLSDYLTSFRTTKQVSRLLN